jgi:hypothetical protein
VGVEQGLAPVSARWETPSREEAESWSNRAAFAAGQLGPVTGVADFGCGWMTLERFLTPGTAYVPIDLVARDHRTLVCDFDSNDLPATGVSAAACLGLLGYLDKPALFMSKLARLHSRAIVSYKTTDALPSLADRRGADLVNDFSKADMSRMFHAGGWEVEAVHQFGNQTIWMLVN